MRLQDIFGAALLGASTLLQAQAMQQDVEAGNIEAELLESRQTSTIAALGVTGNGVQPRLEIRTMINSHPDMFNIFLLALKSFMAVDQSNPLSYYQIAGMISCFFGFRNNRFNLTQVFTEDLTPRGMV